MSLDPGAGAERVASRERSPLALRRSRASDLPIVAGWIESAADCRLWAAATVDYPIDLAALARALDIRTIESWTLTANDAVVGFGQLLDKKAARVHLARVITSPERRGEGLGRRLVESLVAIALSRHPRTVSLRVFADNVVALDLYTSLGFVPLGRCREIVSSRVVYMEYRRPSLSFLSERATCGSWSPRVSSTTIGRQPEPSAESS